MNAASNWLHDDRTTLAEKKILDAAGQAFVELGLDKTNMEDVANFAQCSRATVYRYFKNRHELRLAYVEREAIRIHARIREVTHSISDPGSAILEAISVALGEVRGNPTLAPWFVPEAQGTTTSIAGSSEAMFQMTTLFLDNLLEPAHTAGKLRAGLSRSDAAEWLTRIIISLLTLKGPGLRTPEQEVAYLRTFLLPALIQD